MLPNPTEKSNKKDKKKPSSKKPKFNFYWIYAVIAIGLIALQFFSLDSNMPQINWQRFEQEMLKAHDVKKIVVVDREQVLVYIEPEKLDNEKYKDISENVFGGENKGPHYKFNIGSVETFEDKLEEAQKGFSPEQKVEVYYETSSTFGKELLSWLIPVAILVIIWIFIMRRMSSSMGGGGGQIFNIGKSKAQLFDKDLHVKVTFDHVAGLDEAKEEVKEVVDFLKDPKKYTSLGGKIPKGVLLVGPPGTGKTLLAKAMAGEAKVPFFSISGSDFVEMFVGVGASRVRDLFRQAREKAPCVIFIDEIDAIGRARGRNMMQSNDERENTLNQLLVEMDGFGSESPVIMLAATNRPDVLDPALLRPGRFDRQISIDKPDLAGRDQIFKVHIKPLKVAKTVEPKKLAAQTPGFAGADIANVCNEAALIAARKNKKAIEMDDFHDAIDRIIGGLEKKNKIILPQEKKIIAYHESGHAICGWFLEHAHPLVKVSIVPRGMAALGYAQYLPKEQYLITKDQLVDMICMALGGRAAEEIFFGEVSTGAQNDLERITQIAYSMVTVYGMNPKIGNVSFTDKNQEYNFHKPYSEETARIIDEEVRTLISSAYERTKALLKEKRDDLEKLAKALLEKETIFKDDLVKLIGERPFDNKEDEEAEEQQEEKKAVSGDAGYTVTKDEEAASIKENMEPEEENPAEKYREEEGNNSIGGNGAGPASKEKEEKK